MNDYSAPRRFSSPPTAQELERLAEDVARLYRVAASAIALPPRLGIVREGRTVLERNKMVRIDTSGGQTVRCILPDVRLSGLCGLIRLSGLGSVEVYPAPGEKIDFSDFYSVSNDVGAWLFYSDAIAWFSVR